MSKTSHSSLLSVCALGSLLAAQNGMSQGQPSRQGLTPEIVVQLRSSADAALSPGGREIAYRLDRPRSQNEPPGSAHTELWQVPFAGGAPVQIANAGVQPRAPAWAPDGVFLSWIAQQDASS